MALLSSYSSNNLIIEQGRTTSYSQSMINGSWTYQQGLSWITYNTAWEIHRYCNMSFRYVGMTYSAAKSCAADMVTKYTRSFTFSEWDDANGVFVDNQGGDILMADISINQREGKMYDVIVSVREDDSKIRLAPQTPSTMFPTEDARTYED